MPRRGRMSRRPAPRSRFVLFATMPSCASRCARRERQKLRRCAIYSSPVKTRLGKANTGPEPLGRR